MFQEQVFKQSSTENQCQMKNYLSTNTWNRSSIHQNWQAWYL